MKNISTYPKVLIIYHSRINKADQHGVSLRRWFADWPKENLAQIYSGGEVGKEVFSKYNYKLGQKDRRFGKFFFRLKGSSIGQSSYVISLDENFTKLNKFSFKALFKHKISKWLISTGLWELIFRPILSKEMKKFVVDFYPQVIYCQGYNLTFTWLPVMIHKKFHIPICFQTGDDWPSYLYKDSLIAFAIKPVVHRAVKSLLSKCAERLANGKLMADDYFEKYNMTFKPVMMCDDLARFREVVPIRVVSSDTRSIIYTGSLDNGRWISIIELCEAAKLIQIDGFKIMVTAFATHIPPEAVNKLREIDNLQIRPGPSHEELPSYLKGADILYLPETFDALLANAFRLSISTKAHLYMMSERPVLVYASPTTGIMKYANAEEWACTVEEQNLNKLAQGLLRLLTNTEYCKKLINRGLEVAAKNHDENNVKARFLDILNEIK